MQESPGRVGNAACCGPTTCFINTQLHSASPSTLPCCCYWSGLHGLIASMSWRGKESTVQCLACMNITHGMICSCGVSDVQCSLILKLNSHRFRLSCQCFHCKIEVKMTSHTLLTAFFLVQTITKRKIFQHQCWLFPFLVFLLAVKSTLITIKIYGAATS